MPKTFSPAHAGQWLLESGIQDSAGGVARFYQSDTACNRSVSTEITGYAASTLVYLFTVTGDERYLARARQTTRFLLDSAWSPELRTFPFEFPSPSADSRHHAYFFDCGIIIRGLLAVWHQTHDDELLEVARVAAHAMIADFRTSGDYHPILELPDKEPLPRAPHWSRSSGCYQLKSALAWLDVSALTGDKSFQSAYLELLEFSLATSPAFLQGFQPHATMDRLHAACYFLEALIPFLHRPDCAAAYTAMLSSISKHLDEIGPSFLRCDVQAQLLRARIYGASLVDLPVALGSAEAKALAQFQVFSDDKRIDGGFSFGRRDGVPSPHISPVSTGFALQALEMWRAFEAGQKSPCHYLLI